MAELVIRATKDGKTLWLARRQNRDKSLLRDSVTLNEQHAYRWIDSEDASYNRADAELFRAHAEQHAPADWEIVGL